MIKKILLLTLLVIIGLRNQGQTLKDCDGNVYHTVAMGKQVWMAENLAVTHYRNGDPIPLISGKKEWKTTRKGGWSDYNNHEYNSPLFGHLYNWYAVSDSSNLCPAGWHVPTDDEWSELSDLLGGARVAGGKLKADGLWLYPNTGDEDTSEFSALPGGFRSNNGESVHVAAAANFWTSTPCSETGAWGRKLFFNKKELIRSREPEGYGCSVRCIKDGR